MTRYTRTHFALAAVAAILSGILGAGSARATCVGDCDNSGGVAINEVQACINIFLGTQPLSSCLACDQSGNQSVAINEVQGAINSFLNPATCPMVTPVGTPAANTATPTPTVTNTPLIATPTPTITNTPTATVPIATPTSSPTATVPTVTPSSTRTATATTVVAANTSTPSSTPVNTPTNSATVTNTPTNTQAPTPTNTGGFPCGNGVKEGTEECDDGGTCVNGPTFCFGGTMDGTACDPSIALGCGLKVVGSPAGTPDPECRGIHCTSDAVCGGGQCKPFGGDGCANNCTTETNRVFTFTGKQCSNVGHTGQVCTNDASCGVPGGKCSSMGNCAGGTKDGMICNTGIASTCPSPGVCSAASQAFVQSTSVPIAIPGLGGSMTLSTGKANALSGNLIPVAVRQASVTFNRIENILGNCVCTRGRAVPATHGPLNSGSGYIGCDPAIGFPSGYNVDLSQDHNTTPGANGNSFGRCRNIGGAVSVVCQQDSDCGAGGLCIGVDDPTCSATTTAGTSACLEKKEHCFTNNIGQACTFNSQCGASPSGTCGTTCNTSSPHANNCNGPATASASGSGPQGGAVLLLTSGFGLIADGGTCCTAGPSCLDPQGLKGPDGIPCTDDDPVIARGAAVTVPSTTGNASVSVIDSNNVKGVLLTKGSTACAGAGGCLTSTSGKPFSCSALAANPTGGVSGVRMGGVFPALDQAAGDFAVSTQLQAQ